MASNEEKHSQLVTLRKRYSVAWFTAFVLLIILNVYLGLSKVISYQISGTIVLILCFAIPFMILLTAVIIKKKLKPSWEETLS